MLVLYSNDVGVPAKLLDVRTLLLHLLHHVLQEVDARSCLCCAQIGS